MNPKLIKSEAEHAAALARIDALWSARPGTPEGEELELWVHLVEAYEEAHHAIPLPDPVAAIRFRMEQQGLKPADLVPYIGSKSKVSEVLNGRRPLSLTMIRNLHAGLGIPAEVLLQRPGQALSAVYEGVNWRDFPLAEMLKRQWFPGFAGRANDLCEQAEEILGPLLFPGGQDCRAAGLAARQRVRTGSHADECALWAWQARVLSLANGSALSDYDPRAMTQAFARSLIGLSCLDDGPLQARRLLAKSGIALVALDYLPGTHLDGAAMLRADGKPIIALTLRHDRLDNFWFTLAHEMAHVALHLAGSAGGGFLDDLDPEVAKDQKEDEADEFAAEALIPGEVWETAEARTSAAPEAVRRLAARLHVHPAIVAGRIRFERRDYRLLGPLIGRRAVRRMFAAYKSGDVG